jgi:glycosyltransferase involved in cell wall biosynthesis
VARQLKILQITNRIPFPLNDGGNIAMYNVTKFLNKFGHQVILASLNTKKHRQEPSVLSDIASVFTTDIDTSIRLSGLLTGLFKKLPYNIERFVSAEFGLLLEKIIKDQKPDVIQLEGIYLAVYADRIKKYSSAALLLRSHNIEYEIWERTARNEKNPVKKWYLKNLSAKIKKFEQTVLHRFDAIIAITERDADFYRKNNYKGKIKTIPAGVDLELYQYTKTSSPVLSMCFLGSMEWMPNIQGLEWYLEKVWPSVIRKFPALTLHVAGKNMTAEMKNRKIEGVVFHGMVPDAVTFMNKHPIMIVPLLSGGGMRLKIVEAMALGRCVLSTATGAEGIDAKPNYEILLADTPEEFISKTEALVTNKISAGDIGDNARKLIQENYSWEKLVREIEKFYLELI